MMTASTKTSTTPNPDPVGILRWVFLRGAKALTCEIRVNGPSSHDVCVVPHWDVSAASVERFRRPAEALQRHARIAADLRDRGWSTFHSVNDSPEIAA